MQNIEFIANTDDWKAIKRLKIDEKVPDLDIISFLASVSISFDTQIEKHLRKINDLKPIEEYIDKITKGMGKSEEDLAKVLRGILSPNASKAINACIPGNITPKEKDLLKATLKVYITKKTLAKIGFTIDYTKLPIQINKKRK